MVEKGNGLFFEAINIADFVPIEQFIAAVQELITWVKSSRPRPGVTEVLFPGEPEFRTARKRKQDGIPVEESIWNQICKVAADLGISL